MLLNFEVSNTDFRCTNSEIASTAISIDYLKCHFETKDSIWRNVDAICAIFKSAMYNITKEVMLDSNGDCYVDPEVYKRGGVIQVKLVGDKYVDDTTIISTSHVTRIVEFRIRENIIIPTDTPSKYDVFVAELAIARKAVADIIELMQSKVDAGDFDGEDGVGISSVSYNEDGTVNVVLTGGTTFTSEYSLRGPQGAPGADGNYISNINYASDGTLSILMSDGTQFISEYSMKGEKGDRGETGQTPNFTIGTVETLPSGSDAYVRLTGDIDDPVLNLGIPRGDKGIQGIQGIQGETGATPNLTIGTVETLEPTQDAYVTRRGTDDNPIFDFGIPKGDTGEVTMSQLSALLPTDTASGDIASFPDGTDLFPALSVKAQIEPIQDLHGYDKPWSGGGGANKWDEEWELGGLVWANGEPFSATDRIRSKNFCPILPNTSYYCLRVGANSGGVFFYDENHNFISYDTYNKIVTTPSNAHYFKIGNVDGTTYNHDIAINYPSTVTTYSPYSNICPISGRAECVTEVSGVNVWDEETESGYINADGTPAASATALRSKNFCSCVGGQTYRFQKPTSYTTTPNICWYDADKVFIERSTTSGFPLLTAPTNARYFKISMWNYGATYNHDISINYPSTDHEYHAYDGHTYTTDLGRTVYGGTLDVVSGELTVDRAMVTFDGTENWYNVDTSGEDRNRALYLNIDSPTGQYNWNLIGNYITPTGQGDSSPQLWKANINAAGHLLIGIPKTIATITEWKAYLAQNPLQLCYELATPQTYQLTPQEVKLLLGTNNVWSDGDVTVVYNADIQRYILNNAGQSSSYTAGTGIDITNGVISIDLDNAEGSGY